jgi:hypothetical protein
LSCRGMQDILTRSKHVPSPFVCVKSCTDNMRSMSLVVPHMLYNFIYAKQTLNDCICPTKEEKAILHVCVHLNSVVFSSASWTLLNI